MSAHRPVANADALRLATDAAEWMLLARLFERPVAGWHDSVASLSGEIADPLLGEAAAAADGARHEQHIALFGPGQAVSPREVSYAAFHDPGKILASLRAFYEAFAFTPATDEPDDHVAVETAFVAYLCLKESYALARGDAADVEVCATARARFIDEHLARLGQRMSARMADDVPTWIRLAASALHARTAHVQLPPDAPTLADTSPFTGCDSCG